MNQVINDLEGRLNLMLEIMKEGRDMVSAQEAAQITGFNRQSIYNAFSTGRIQKHRVRGKVFIRIDDLTMIMNRQRSKCNFGQDQHCKKQRITTHGISKRNEWESTREAKGGNG